MNNEITKHPEVLKKENIIKDLEGQLKKRKSALKSLKTRLQNMQSEIEEISRNVQTKMMHKLEQIDILRQEIADLAQQLKKSKGISKEDKRALEGMAEDLSNENNFGEGFEQYKEHKARMEQGDFDFDEDQRAKMRDIFEQFYVKPPEKEQRNIRKVFLKLSQKFHPDRAKSKKEEAEFHQMMQEINEAYQKNDIHTLLELERLYLMEEMDFSGKSITMDDLDRAIERLEREVQFIEGQIDRTSLEVKNIRKSDLGQMLTSVNRAEREGEGFDAMEAEYNETIEIFTKLRDGLKDSIERDEISPQLVGAMGGSMMGNPDIENMDMGDILKMISGMDDGDDDFNPFAGMFGEEEEAPLRKPKFKIGDSVRVMVDEESEFDEDVSIKGWEGRIVEGYYDEFEGGNIYTVEYDSISMKEMPIESIEEGLEYDFDFQEQEIIEENLKKVKARDTEGETLATYRRIYHEINWQHLKASQKERFQKVLFQFPEKTDAENWKSYLKKHLKFPFQAKTRDLLKFQGIPKNQECKVLGLDRLDEMGWIALILPKGSRQKSAHPIGNLRPIKTDKKTIEVLNDYADWAEDMVFGNSEYY